MKRLTPAHLQLIVAVASVRADLRALLPVVDPDTRAVLARCTDRLTAGLKGRAAKLERRAA